MLDHLFLFLALSPLAYSLLSTFADSSPSLMLGRRHLKQFLDIEADDAGAGGAAAFSSSGGGVKRGRPPASEGGGGPKKLKAQPQGKTSDHARLFF